MINNKTKTRLLCAALCTIFIICQFVVFAATPTAADFTKSTVKNSAITFALEDFQNNMAVEEEESEAITSIKIVSLPDATNATFSLNEDPITADQEIPAEEIEAMMFVPELEWVGTTSFGYQVKTDSDYSNTATVMLEITEDTQNPLHVEDMNIATQKNTPVGGQLIGSSDDDKPYAFIITKEPSKGSVNLTDVQTGTFIYTPSTDETGDDNFSFKIKSAEFESEEGLVMVTISDEEIPPPPTGFYYADMLGHWGEFSAIKLAENEALIGEQFANKFFFYPYKQMSRGDFILLATAAIGYDNLPEPDPQFRFADHDSIPEWLKSPAYSAYAAGIIQGSSYPDGTIRLEPQRVINRIESIAVLNNIMKPESESDVELDYADLNEIPEWGHQYVKNVEGYGLVKGYDDNTLRPFRQITKVESAEMIYQVMKYLGKYPETLTKLSGKTILQAVPTTADADSKKGFIDWLFNIN